MKQKIKKILDISLLDIILYIKQNLEKKKRKQKIRNYLNNNSVLKLQVGCGANDKVGWLNTDLKPKNKKIIHLDVSKPFPFEDNTFNFIYSEHNFEHLKFTESCSFLSESFRVLKPNGVIRIAAPDLDFLVKLYQNPELPLHKEYVKWSRNKYCKDVSTYFKDDNPFDYVYVVNKFFRAWGHQIIPTYGSLKQLLELHQFVNIQKKEISESSFKELCNMEQHGKQISAKFNELETIVIEAQKPA